MAKNITLMGASYSDVPAVILPKTGGGTARFDDASVTTAVEADVASGKIFLKADGSIGTGTASGGGGGGIGTLLTTYSVGQYSTSSTQATNMNKSFTVSGYNSYDALIVETSVNTKTNGRHAATVAWIFLTASTTQGTKNGTSISSNKWNCKYSSNGTATTRAGTTAYGIYPYSATISNSTLTISLYSKYNSTSTGTINGNYTTRVYGVKLYDLIGG